MRRKTLQDVTNTLCQMLVGWRMGEDLEILADLPDGVITLDLLNESATHGERGTLNLKVTEELSAWLRKRLASLSIPLSELVVAKVHAEFRTDRVKTNRKKIVSFDWRCESVLGTGEKEYVGRLAEKHQWHTRNAA